MPLILRQSPDRPGGHAGARAGGRPVMLDVLSTMAGGIGDRSLAAWLLRKDDRGGTPLHLAAANGDADTVRRLLHEASLLSRKRSAWRSMPATLLACSDRKGESALHSAAREGYGQSVRAILDAAGRI